MTILRVISAYLSGCVNVNSLLFGPAFDLMKKHRINMNLIYDHNPSAFHANTEMFVRQLDLPTNINLFLTDLRSAFIVVCSLET